MKKDAGNDTAVCLAAAECYTYGKHDSDTDRFGIQDFIFGCRTKRHREGAEWSPELSGYFCRADILAYAAEYCDMDGSCSRGIYGFRVCSGNGIKSGV